MPVYVGSARIDERGKISGGSAGDQTGKEVAYQKWYLHSKGWVVIRAKDDNVRNKIAYAMKAACDNNKIGYDQRNRYGLYNAVKKLGFDPAKCNVNTETDCSALVRVCICYAIGRSIPDFNTAGQLNVLKNTGLFDIYTDDNHCKKSDYLLPGDILVTKTKGHTVAVISVPSTNTSKPTTPSNTSTVTILKKGSTGDQVKTLQTKLNILGYNLKVDGSFGSITDKAVRDFQKKYGLYVDGIVGEKTIKKLDEVIASMSNNSSVTTPLVTIAKATLKKGAKGDNVKVLQNNLNAIIKSGLKVDGSFGTITETSVKTFQKKYGLYVDGIYGPKSEAKMNSLLNV